VNPGGEPERDDTGLPPVDIEIPDDARELDRDVQAYFRELRAERRHQRRRRLHVGLTRDGVILPLLACCLILALITGTLLTVFTATSDQNLGTLPPGSANPNKSSSPPTTSPSASSSASPPAGGTPAGAKLNSKTVRLPYARIAVDGTPYSLPTMFGIMLVLIPPRCHCMTAVSRLAMIGVSTEAGAILVAAEGTITEAQRYRAGLQPGIANNVGVAIDAQGALQKAVPAKGLTAVVISQAATAGGAQRVAYANDVTSSDLSSASSPLSVALASGLQAALRG